MSCLANITRRHRGAAEDVAATEGPIDRGLRVNTLTHPAVNAPGYYNAQFASTLHYAFPADAV